MRGDEQRQAGFIVLTSLEDRVPADHPLRAIRTMIDAALERDGRVAFRYCDASGAVGGEANPNGSVNSIAGVYNARFNVLGLMPHPENLIDPLVGGIDGRAMFRALAAA